MYKFRTIIRKPEICDHFSKIVICYKQKGYRIDVLKLYACLAVNPITIDNFGNLFYCTLVGRGLDSMMVPTYKLLIRWSGQEHFMSVSRLIGVHLMGVVCSSFSVVLLDNTGI